MNTIMTGQRRRSAVRLGQSLVNRFTMAHDLTAGNLRWMSSSHLVLRTALNQFHTRAKLLKQFSVLSKSPLKVRHRRAVLDIGFAQQGFQALQKQLSHGHLFSEAVLLSECRDLVVLTIRKIKWQSLAASGQFTFRVAALDGADPTSEPIELHVESFRELTYHLWPGLTASGLIARDLGSSNSTRFCEILLTPSHRRPRLGQPVFKQVSHENDQRVKNSIDK
ncbi:hypothetical protein D3C71_1481010 [compost metagenome]